jgi:8-oxo-dGTP diphosphatase
MPNPQGYTKLRYQVIPRVLVFLTRGDEVLLLKRADDRPIFPGLYNGLGGHVERGEGVLAAARREVEEESGLRPARLWLCATVSIDTGDPAAGILMSVFCGEVAAEGSQLRASDEGTLQWVPVAQIPTLPMVEDIPTLLPKVLEVEPGDAPLWGLYVYDADGKLHMQFD